MPEEATNTQNTAASSNVGGNMARVLLDADTPSLFRPLMSMLRMKRFFDRTTDAGILNPVDGSSIALRENSVNEASSINTSVKTIGDGVQQQNVVQSLEQRFITNRMRIDTDEIILNSHKLNPWLWEYADYKANANQWGQTGQVGNFCLFGTVMVKAWDHNLGKYVLIRRLARMPMFGPTLDVPKIAEGFEIQDDSERVNNYPAKQATESGKDYYSRISKQAAQNKANQQTQPAAPASANNAKNTTTQQTNDTIEEKTNSTTQQTSEITEEKTNSTSNTTPNGNTDNAIQKGVETNTKNQTAAKSSDYSESVAEKWAKEASKNGIGKALRESPSAKEIIKNIANIIK